MIEERARVIAVDNDQLVLEAQTQSTCTGCAARQGCGTSVLSRWVGRRFTRFQVPNTVNARVGDEVVVGLAEEAMLQGSLLVYLMPLLAMIVSAVLADTLLATDTAARELLVLASAIVGFALMLSVSHLILASKGRRSRLTPVVLRKNTV